MLESPLRDLLASQLSAIEEGLELLSTEEYIPSNIGTRSFIDILARDKRGRWVLIELKRSDSAARQAIHEVYKYVESVKRHFGARDDEIRAIIISTEWKELLAPFSRFFHDTEISVSGLRLILNDANDHITTQAIEPQPLATGRVLSPWHEISLYESEMRLAEGLASYDASCQTKGINDYVMLEMRAPEGFHEASVATIAKMLKDLRGEAEEPTEEEASDVAAKMTSLEYMIYFVPQLQALDEYLEMIRADSEVYEEVQEIIDGMEGEELLCTLQKYAFYAAPNIDRDHFEIGYPAKFRSKLLDNEGWTINAIHRRGAFLRNKTLSDDIIINEIAGEAGTSGQRLKRSIVLSDKAEFAQILRDLDECLPNNPVWRSSVRAQLEEAKKDFPESTAEISIYSPSTGVLTLYFSATQDMGALYVPNYAIYVKSGEKFIRAYFGELLSESDTPKEAETFNEMLVT